MMAGKTVSERLATAQAQKHLLDTRIRELEVKVADAERRADTHRKIVLGAILPHLDRVNGELAKYNSPEELEQRDLARQEYEHQYLGTLSVESEFWRHMAASSPNRPARRGCSSPRS